MNHQEALEVVAAVGERCLLCRYIVPGSVLSTRTCSRTYPINSGCMHHFDSGGVVGINATFARISVYVEDDPNVYAAAAQKCAALGPCPAFERASP